MGPFLQEVFMSIIHTILQCSGEPFDPRDEEVTMTLLTSVMCLSVCVCSVHAFNQTIQPYYNHSVIMMSSLQAARDKQNLQKCYYQFISSLVNNNAVEVISSQGEIT